MPVPRIVLVGADKGGVGKTTVARVLIDRAGKFGARPRVVDTEPAPGVLKRFYSAAELIDVRSVAGQMAVMDNPGALTVIDVRAGLLLLVLRALRDAGLLEDAKAGQIRFVVAHIVGPTHASFSEIAPAAEILAQAGSGALHVLVKNHASTDMRFEWQSNAPTISVLHLDDLAAAAIDGENEMPEAFASDPSKSRMLRGNVRHWLDRIYAELTRAGLDAELMPAP